MDSFLGVAGQSQLLNNTSHDLFRVGTFELVYVLCEVNVDN